MQFLIAILVIAALTPGATILCQSSSGHIALESQLATCCTALPAPSQDGGPAVSDPVSKGCAGCSDVPVVAVTESRVQTVYNGNDQALFTPVTPVLKSSPTVFEQSFPADIFPSSTNQSASTPLRC